MRCEIDFSIGSLQTGSLKILSIYLKVLSMQKIFADYYYDSLPNLAYFFTSRQVMFTVNIQKVIFYIK